MSSISCQAALKGPLSVLGSHPDTLQCLPHRALCLLALDHSWAFPLCATLSPPSLVALIWEGQEVGRGEWTGPDLRFVSCIMAPQQWLLSLWSPSVWAPGLGTSSLPVPASLRAPAASCHHACLRHCVNVSAHLLNGSSPVPGLVLVPWPRAAASGTRPSPLCWPAMRLALFPYHWPCVPNLLHIPCLLLLSWVTNVTLVSLSGPLVAHHCHLKSP